MTNDLPPVLQELLLDAFGDAEVLARPHSRDSVYTLYVLDDDGCVYRWLASLSLDGRWTVSPRGLTWQSDSTFGKD